MAAGGGRETLVERLSCDGTRAVLTPALCGCAAVARADTAVRLCCGVYELCVSVSVDRELLPRRSSQLD
ncbi:hypothetical protein RR48_02939 [Papilio machaon]|uniref:Uncharacterized protein n=1 Tax=Papilio machaon TaxID=76193 RepID=A0A0N0PBI1_PAPMA|nr:hypothetical protein RR48_02939 [Papilio machaon]